MNTYEIDVSRVVHDLLRKTVTVEANSREEALKIARRMNQEGKIDLEFSSQIESEPADYEITEGPEDPEPINDQHTGGEWVLGEPLWIEDERHYNKGGQRFVPVEANHIDGRKYCTVALVLADEDDPECEPNARLIKAAPKMLAQLRLAAAYCQSLNGTAPTFEDAKAPDGDDFNELMRFVDAAIAAYEGGK